MTLKLHDLLLPALIGVVAFSFAGAAQVPSLTFTTTVAGSDNTPGLQIAPTWNTSGIVDAALLINLTNTTSGAGSKLLDAKTGGTSVFSVDPAGNTALSGSLSLLEGSAPSSLSGSDVCYGESVLHGLKCSYNGSGFLPVPLLGGSLNTSGLAYLDGTVKTHLDTSADFTISSHTLAAATTSASLNLAGGAPTNGLVIPQGSGCVPVEGAECYDPTQQVYLGTDHTSTPGSFPRLVYSVFNYTSPNWMDVLCFSGGDSITHFPCNNATTSITTETSFNTAWAVPNWALAGKRLLLKLQLAATTTAPGTPQPIQISVRWGGTAGSSSPGGTLIYQSGALNSLSSNLSGDGFEGACTLSFVSISGSTASVFPTCELIVPGWSFVVTRNTLSLPIASVTLTGTQNLVVTAKTTGTVTTGQAIALSGLQIFTAN